MYCYVTHFSWKIDTHLTPRNANNIEPYAVAVLSPGKVDTPSVTQHLNGPYATQFNKSDIRSPPPPPPPYHKKGKSITRRQKVQMS